MAFDINPFDGDGIELDDAAKTAAGIAALLMLRKGATMPTIGSQSLKSYLFGARETAKKPAARAGKEFVKMLQKVDPLTNQPYYMSPELGLGAERAVTERAAARILQAGDALRPPSEVATMVQRNIDTPMRGPLGKPGPLDYKTKTVRKVMDDEWAAGAKTRTPAEQAAGPDYDVYLPSKAMDVIAKVGGPENLTAKQLQNLNREYMISPDLDITNPASVERARQRLVKDLAAADIDMTSIPKTADYLRLLGEERAANKFGGEIGARFRAQRRYLKDLDKLAEGRRNLRTTELFKPVVNEETGEVFNVVDDLYKAVVDIGDRSMISGPTSLSKKEVEKRVKRAFAGFTSITKTEDALSSVRNSIKKVVQRAKEEADYALANVNHINNPRAYPAPQPPSPIADLFDVDIKYTSPVGYVKDPSLKRIADYTPHISNQKTIENNNATHIMLFGKSYPTKQAIQLDEQIAVLEQQVAAYPLDQQKAVEEFLGIDVLRKKLDALLKKTKPGRKKQSFLTGGLTGESVPVTDTPEIRRMLNLRGINLGPWTKEQEIQKIFSSPAYSDIIQEATLAAMARDPGAKVPISRRIIQRAQQLRDRDRYVDDAFIAQARYSRRGGA